MWFLFFYCINNLRVNLRGQPKVLNTTKYKIIIDTATYENIIFYNNNFTVLFYYNKLFYVWLKVRKNLWVSVS